MLLYIRMRVVVSSMADRWRLMLSIHSLDNNRAKTSVRWVTSWKRRWKQLRNNIFFHSLSSRISKRSAFDLFLKEFFPKVLNFCFIAFILDFGSCISAFFSSSLSTFCPAKINLSRSKLLFKILATGDENGHRHLSLKIPNVDFFSTLDFLY